MYSMVLMMALSNGATAVSLDPESGYAASARFGNQLPGAQLDRKGCNGCKGGHGCHGKKGCNGCYGGCYGCYGGYAYSCHGGYSYGCYGGGMSYGCSGYSHGCYGGHASYGCGGGHVIYSGGHGHAYSGVYGSDGYAVMPDGSGYTSGYFQPSDMQYAPGEIQNPASDRSRRDQNRRDQNRDAKPTRDEDQESAGPAPATITVRLPAGARLIVDGAPTRSTSATRSFVTPELERGKDFHYTLEAQIVQNGKPVTLSKRVAVRAGEESQVTFDAASSSVAQR